MSIKSWLKFAYLGIVWGSTFLWIKIGLEEIPPITFTAMRLLVAVCGLVAINLIIKPKLPRRANWRDFLFLGVFNIALPFALITWSEQYVSSGSASILNATTPLFTLMLAPFFVPEDRFTWPKVLGMVLGFAGVVVLVTDNVSAAFAGFRWGELVVLVASLSYAVAIIYARRRTVSMAPSMQALGQNIFATILLWPLALGLEGPLVLPRQTMTWVAVIWLGIMATCIGTVLYYALLKEVGPTRTTLTTYLFPLMGVLLGAIFLDEQVGLRMLVGGLFILGGVILVNSNLSINFKSRDIESERSK